jgi:hypothetical protein
MPYTPEQQQIIDAAKARASYTPEQQQIIAAASARAAPPKPTQFASAAPTGMDALKAHSKEFAGRTKQYAHEQLQAMRDRETKRNQPTLAGVLESMNPLSYAADVGNKLAFAASPFAAAGGMVGARIDPTYGKPGSGGNELQKYEDLGAALAPIPGPKMLAPGGRLIAKAAAPGARLAEGLAAAGGRAFAPVADVAFAGRRAKAAVSDIRSQALAKALEETQAAKSTELGARTKATTAQIRQQAAQAKAEDITPIGVGDVSHLSEIGGPGQKVAIANAAAAEKAKKVAFDTHASAIDDVVKANEGNGIYINDLPETKSLLKEVKDQTKISPTTSPTAAPRVTVGQNRAYGMVEDALKNNTVPLSYKEARIAQENGFKVLNKGTEANAYYVRVFKTPLEAVTNLRRYFGDAAYGKADVSGFEGVGAKTFRDLNERLRGIEDAYTAGLGKEQRGAYQAALANAEKYSTGTGGKLTATEGQQEVAKMAASKVRNAVVGGGADAYNQFKAITDPVVARKFANDVVETVLYDAVKGGPKGYEASINLVKPGTQLGDMIHAIPELEVKVQQHLKNLNDAERAGIRAEALGGTAKVATDSAKSARANKINYQTQIVGLEKLPDEKLLPEAQKIFEKLRTEEKITNKQYKEYMDQIQSANKNLGIKKTRNLIGRTLLIAAGLGQGAHVVGNVMKLGQ